MTSLSCGVDVLLRAAQYLQYLEEQESGQQLYRPIVLENPPLSTGIYLQLLFPYSHLREMHFSKKEKKNVFQVLFCFLLLIKFNFPPQSNEKYKNP